MRNSLRTIVWGALCMIAGITASSWPTLILGELVSENAARATDTEWLTDFEKSEGRRTPRYEATVAYCRRLAAASPRLQYTEFGTSPQGRPLPLLIADRHGRFTPEDRHRSENAVVLVQACIHAGECCGKDAGLMLLRDITVADQSPELLDHVTLLFIPIFNVDGHERFGPYNRINQNGPDEMGWRVTAQNLNLNRDYLKADAPEMQAWLRLFQAWQPDFCVDVHSTDGADYQYAITFGLEVTGSMHSAPTAWAQEYQRRIVSAMDAVGFPVSPYVMFRRWHDPRSGLVSWTASPRFSQGYTALHNVPCLLVEAHMLKPYPVRVEGTYQMLKQTLVILNEEHRELKQAIAAAEAHTASAAFRAEPLPLRFEIAEDFTTIDFLGYEYEVIESEVSGGDWFRYSRKPTTDKIPYHDKQRPIVLAELPEAYMVPPEWSEVIARLELHGVAVKRLRTPITVEVRSYKFWDVTWQERPYEGRHPVRFQADELREKRTYPAGSAVIDIRQRAAKVAANILEPYGSDSYVQWGFFDAVLSRVEYFESYVMEAMAREMLAGDPDLRREFEQKKATDEEFAANSRAILDWFYQRTSYFDRQYNIYPVGWIDERRVVEGLPLVVSDEFLVE